VFSLTLPFVYGNSAAGSGTPNVAEVSHA